MKNLAKRYSGADWCLDPIWVERKVGRRYVGSEWKSSIQRMYEEDLRQSLEACLFVVEDANRPGDLAGFNSRQEAEAFCDRKNEEGCAFFILLESRGLA